MGFCFLLLLGQKKELQTIVSALFSILQGLQPFFLKKKTLKIKFPQHKSSSLTFEAFTALCDYHLYQVLGHFHLSQMKSVPLDIPSPQSLATIDKLLLLCF